jgi:cell division septal protein FtsQ
VRWCCLPQELPRRSVCGRGELSAVPRGRELAAARAPARSSTALQLLPSGRSLAVGFGLLTAAFALYLGARETAVFSVRSIDVATDPRGHTGVVARALAPIAGTSLLEVDEAVIASRLEPLPHVHLLGYDRSFPNGLSVRVSVEAPVAVLRRAGENWLVSVEGRVLRKLEVRLRRPLPVVWVPRSVEPEIGVLVRADAAVAAVRALASMRSAAPAFFRRIWYVAPGEHGLTVVLRDRLQLRLGAASDLPLKLEVGRQVLAAVTAAGGAVAYVDVSVPGRPVAGATLDSQVEP